MAAEDEGGQRRQAAVGEGWCLGDHAGRRVQAGRDGGAARDGGGGDGAACPDQPDADARCGTVARTRAASLSTWADARRGRDGGRERRRAGVRRPPPAAARRPRAAAGDVAGSSFSRMSRKDTWSSAPWFWMPMWPSSQAAGRVGVGEVVDLHAVEADAQAFALDADLVGVPLPRRVQRRVALLRGRRTGSRRRSRWSSRGRRWRRSGSRSRCPRPTRGRRRPGSPRRHRSCRRPAIFQSSFSEYEPSSSAGRTRAGPCRRSEVSVPSSARVKEPGPGLLPVLRAGRAVEERPVAVSPAGSRPAPAPAA